MLPRNPEWLNYFQCDCHEGPGCHSLEDVEGMARRIAHAHVPTETFKLMEQRETMAWYKKYADLEYGNAAP